jgi:tetratricopeptide (TPR) repeat protein
MADLPPELTALLAGLTPEQRATFFSILQSARDQEGFNRELARHPELLAALQRRIASASPAIPADLQTILAELDQPARSLREMPRRIELCRRALSLVSKQGNAELWASLQAELAESLVQDPTSPRADNLDQAIAHFQQALEVYTRQAFPEHWTTTQNNLAIAYGDRIRGERADNLEQAIAHYQQALDVRTLDRFPRDFQQTQRNLGHLHFGERQWAEVLAAYRQAIDAEKRLLAEVYTEAGRRAETAETSTVYARAAYALAKLGRCGEAFVKLEQGKARLLSQALALAEMDLSRLPSEQQQTLRSLRQQIRELEHEMRLPADTPARRDERTFAAALAQARARLQEAIAAARRNDPDLLPEGLDLAEILVLIPRRAVLVAPVVTAQGAGDRRSDRRSRVCRGRRRAAGTPVWRAAHTDPAE